MLGHGPRMGWHVLFGDNISFVATIHRPFQFVFVVFWEGRP